MEGWNTVRIYCSNCGTLLSGIADSKGVAKFYCKKCKVSIVSSLKIPKSKLSVGSIKTLYITIK